MSTGSASSGELVPPRGSSSAAASQAVAEDLASWVSQAVNNDRNFFVNGVRREGLDHALALVEPRGRELLVDDQIMEGPYFQSALASYVAHVGTIASAASADLERRAATGPTADLVAHLRRLRLEERGMFDAVFAAATT